MNAPIARHAAAPKPRTAAIVQSSYIPWKGFFDLINSVDEFVLFDDVQFTRRDWRSRNRIKTPQGLQWLSVPIDVKGNYHMRIRDARVSDPEWGRRHWETLRHSYSRAPHFDIYAPLLESIYLGNRDPHLSQINGSLIDAICGILDIRTRITWSMQYQLHEGRNERLIGLVKDVGCDCYLSGPSARDYLAEDDFNSQGISVRFADYSGYPEYPQLHGPFEHAVSILDLLFCVGPDAPRYMKSFEVK